MMESPILIMGSVHRRAYDLLASIYLYNEHRGYTQLEKLLESIRERFPDEVEFISAVERHLEDERRHYRMFREYFRHEGRMPFKIGAAFGYIDLLVRRVLKCRLEELDPRRILSQDGTFFQLCRLIMVTEFRGLKQVEKLRRMAWIRRHPRLSAIFKVVEADEPHHCLPYEAWLARSGDRHRPNRHERFADWRTHCSLVCLRIPAMFFNPWLQRRVDFPA